MSGGLPSLSFFDYHASSVAPELLDARATLFSSAYGVWSPSGPRPGHNVKLSAKRLQALLLFDPNTCRLAVAKTLTGEVIPQAFYCNFPYKFARPQQRAKFSDSAGTAAKVVKQQHLLAT